MIAPLGEIDYSLSGQMMRLGVVQTAYLTIAVDGVQYSRIPVKCEIKRFEPVLTAAATISARQKLTADSVRLMRLDTSRLPDDYLRNPAQAVDLMVNRSLAAGSVILASYLDKPVLIKRGTPVKIVAAIGGVEATAAGLAQRDGREGQFISVRNTATGRLLTARVIRAGLVEVLAN
jgi:flagella basal body P-ring formation protein FlgA